MNKVFCFACYMIVHLELTTQKDGYVTICNILGGYVTEMS